MNILSLFTLLILSNDNTLFLSFEIRNISCLEIPICLRIFSICFDTL